MVVKIQAAVFCAVAPKDGGIGVLQNTGTLPHNYSVTTQKNAHSQICSNPTASAN